MTPMKRLLALIALLVGGGFAASCQRSPAPAPAPPPPDPAAHVWAALVEAGCAEDTPEGPDAIAQEAQLGTAWTVCMLDGGSLSACGAPCGQGDP